MMFPKGSDEIRAENQNRLCSISIYEPVHNAGNQINLYITNDDRQRQDNPSVRTVQSRGQFPAEPNGQRGESSNRRKLCYAMES